MIYACKKRTDDNEKSKCEYCGKEFTKRHKNHIFCLTNLMIYQKHKNKHMYNSKLQKWTTRRKFEYSVND